MGDRAKALLVAWQTAQNEQDFDAYSRLYAKRFSGIKRVGKHTAWYSRKSWLDDRKGMFRPGLRVEASDASIRASRTTARVLFTQSFTASKFHDVGRKELVLVEQDGALRISREEMLMSRVAGDTSASAGATKVFAVHSGEVYLQPSAPLDGDQALKLRKRDTYVIERKLDPGKLAPELKARLGESLVVVNPDGSPCPTQVKSLSARAEAVPHWGIQREWEGIDPAQGSDKPVNPPTPDSEIATTLWDWVPEQQRYLVGTLDPPCHGGVVAVGGSGIPKGFAASKPASDTSLLAKDAFRKLPEYGALQKEFDAKNPGAPGRRWDDVDADVNEASFALAPNQALVIRSVVAGEGCGGFFGILSALFEIDTSQKPARMLKKLVLEQETGANPVLAIDSDGDGNVEIISGPVGFDGELSLFVINGTNVSRESLYSYSFMSCPC